MSSQATPQLLNARRARAREEFPRFLDAYLKGYIESIKARNPGYEPDEAEKEVIRKRLQESISIAAR